MKTEEYRERQQRDPLLEEEEDYVPLELQCVECGKEESGRCSCCGSPLCMMHAELQANFCSNFGTYQIDGQEKTGCKHGEEFIEFEEADWEQEEVAE